MRQYLDFMRHVYEHGTTKTDRTGTGTRSVFGYQMRFDLQEGFPMVTTKKLHLKSIVHELIWFLAGSTNIGYLKENGVSIWDEWADPNGDLGPVYGSQWRSWPTPDGGHIDQIKQLVDQIKNNPDSRRLIVSAWNVADIPRMKLPPCHAHMMAEQTGLHVGDFIWTGGDCHIYSNHFDQVQEQLSRSTFPLPTLVLKRKPASVFEYRYEDIEIVGYECHPAIKAPVAV